MGKPFDTGMQATTLRLALDLVTSATAPVIQHTPFRWSESEVWCDNYMRVDDSNREALRLAGEQNRQERLANKAKGLKRN